MCLCSNRDAAQPAAAGSVSPSTRSPEVDEEGYSIRPPDASEIKFDDAEENQWSSDSDDEGGSLSHMPITCLVIYLKKGFLGTFLCTYMVRCRQGVVLF